jgi:DnaK suppressor protein
MSSVTISQSGSAVIPIQQGGSPGLMQRRAQLERYWRARLERVTELSLAYHDAAQLARQTGQGEQGGQCGQNVQSWQSGHGGQDEPAGQSRAARRVRRLARRTVAERQALAEIEAALNRIANGQYGRCEQCREAIAPALLARQPQARYCTACSCLAAQRVG